MKFNLVLEINFWIPFISDSDQSRPSDLTGLRQDRLTVNVGGTVAGLHYNINSVDCCWCCQTLSFIVTQPVLSFRCTIVYYQFMSILRVIYTPAEAAPHTLCRPRPLVEEHRDHRHQDCHRDPSFQSGRDTVYVHTHVKLKKLRPHSGRWLKNPATWSHYIF